MKQQKYNEKLFRCGGGEERERKRKRAKKKKDRES